jgi:hypothetical protein
MSLESWAKLLREPLPLRVAGTAVIAGFIVVVSFWFAGAWLRHLLAQPGVSVVAVIFVVAGMIVSFAVATLIMGAAAGVANQVGVASARQIATHHAKEEAQRQRDAAVRQETRLAALLPVFPESHRTVLARFAGDGVEHISLPRAGEIGARSITKALIEAGYLIQVAPVDEIQAIYALHPSATIPVREYVLALQAAEAAKRRAQTEAAVLEADSSARRLLQLFGDPNPEDGSIAPHPWLTWDVYASIAPLIRRGVLDQLSTSVVVGMGDSRADYVAPIALTEDGKRAVELHILGQMVARARIDIHLDHVHSPGASGGGARSSI